jgi:hypothetical protein
MLLSFHLNTKHSMCIHYNCTAQHTLQGGVSSLLFRLTVWFSSIDRLIMIIFENVRWVSVTRVVPTVVGNE